MTKKAYYFAAAKPVNPDKHNPVCCVEEFDEGAKEITTSACRYTITAHEGGRLFIFLARQGAGSNQINNIATWLSINRNAREIQKSRLDIWGSYTILSENLIRRRYQGFELDWHPAMYRCMNPNNGFYFNNNLAPSNENPISICEILANIDPLWLTPDSDIGTQGCPCLTAEHLDSQLLNIIKKQVIPEINSVLEHEIQADADTNASTNALCAWLQYTGRGYSMTTIRKALFGPTHTVKPNSADKTLFSKYAFVKEEDMLLFKNNGTTYELPFFNGKFNPAPEALELMRADFDRKLEKQLKAADAIIDKFYASVTRNVVPIKTMEEELEAALPSFLQAKAVMALDRYKATREDPWTVSKAYLEIDWGGDHEPYNFYTHGVGIIQKYAAKLAKQAPAYSNTDETAHHFVPLAIDKNYSPSAKPGLLEVSALAKWCSIHTKTELDAYFLGAWLYKCAKQGSGGRQVLWLVNPGQCGTSTYVNYIYRSVDGSGAIYTRDETDGGFFGQSIMGRKICAFVDIHSKPLNLLRNILNFTEAEVLTTNVKNRAFATFTARGLKVMVATNERLSFDEDLAWATSRVFPVEVCKAEGPIIPMGEMLDRLQATQDANIKWSERCYQHLEYYGYITGHDFMRIGASEYEERVQKGVQVAAPLFTDPVEGSRAIAEANMNAVSDDFINFYERELKEDSEDLMRKTWALVKPKLPVFDGEIYVNSRLLVNAIMNYEAALTDGYDAVEDYIEKLQKMERPMLMLEAQRIIRLVKDQSWAKFKLSYESKKEKTEKIGQFGKGYKLNS